MALRDMEVHVRAVFDPNPDFADGSTEPDRPERGGIRGIANPDFADGSTEPDRPERRGIRGILRASIAWLFRLVRLASRWIRALF